MQTEIPASDTGNSRYESANAEDLLKTMGYDLSVDYDGSLLVESEYAVPYPLIEWLTRNQRNLLRKIEYRGQCARAVFFGGSMAGKHHSHHLTCFTQQVYEHIARGHWETYEFRGKDDPRLYFVGRTTSKVKAKRLGSATPQ